MKRPRRTDRRSPAPRLACPLTTAEAEFQIVSEQLRDNLRTHLAEYRRLRETREKLSKVWAAPMKMRRRRSDAA